MPFNSELIFGKDFKLVNNHFELSPEYLKKNSWRFKKITATRFCAVLGLDDFVSPAKIWTQIVNIYSEPMDPYTSNVGNVVEPKVREFINKQLIQKTGINFTYSFYKPSEVNYDVFKGQDDIFGGIPDGEPYVDGALAYDKGLPLLEIKSSSIDSLMRHKENGILVLDLDDKKQAITKIPGAKKAKWINKLTNKVEVPLNYIHQVSLYLYLRNITKGLIACVFVDTKDYTNPKKVVVSRDNILASTITIDLEQVGKKVEQARQWYNKFVKTGVSPDLTEKDMVWLKEVGLIK